MRYRHRDHLGQPLPLEPGKVVCVGVNYHDHAKEMASTPSTLSQPTLFMKPRTALVNLEQGFPIPEGHGPCHHELELAVLIGSRLNRAKAEQVPSAIVGYGLALDLTLRELQQSLKERGRPWECAKSFDGSCPISGFVRRDELSVEQGVDIALTVNGELRQQTNTLNMVIALAPLIALMSNWFTLEPGDIVLTGTPEGVAALHPGDQLSLQLANQYDFTSQVIAE